MVKLEVAILLKTILDLKKIEGSRLADLMQEQATDLGATIDEFDMVEKNSIK